MVIPGAWMGKKGVDIAFNFDDDPNIAKRTVQILSARVVSFKSVEIFPGESDVDSNTFQSTIDVFWMMRILCNLPWKLFSPLAAHLLPL